jgi:dihydrofolate synthase/folylpolyglutamate synthase
VEPEALHARLTALEQRARTGGYDLKLTRMRDLLERLGNPEAQLPPVIHVAGTNGKGSTIAYLRAMLEAWGKRVHVYTSPHLVRFNERILLAGQEVDDATLEAELAAIQPAVDATNASFFEATTALAFRLFARVPADILLLETGLGGRLDATNVIEKPLATIITPIGMDHTAYLGETLAAIAGEKAGIIKPGVPVILAPQAPKAEAVLVENANRLGAPCYRYGVEWGMEGNTLYFQHAEFRIQDSESPLPGGGREEAAPPREKITGNWQLATGNSTLNPHHDTLPPPALPGAHQWQNAGTAVACCLALWGSAFPPAAMQAITHARWPARLQWLVRLPYGIALPETARVWLDGGHNPHAAEAIATFLRADGKNCRCVLVCGMLADKDVEGFLNPLRAILSRCIAVPIAGASQAIAPEALASIAQGLGIPAVACDSLETGLREAVQTRDDPRPLRLVIAGSLYLAGVCLRDA